MTDQYHAGAGQTTCAGYPASLEYETIDAQTFSDWGIDCVSHFLGGVV